MRVAAGLQYLGNPDTIDLQTLLQHWQETLASSVLTVARCSAVT
jgi:hypothetical protein